MYAPGATNSLAMKQHQNIQPSNIFDIQFLRVHAQFTARSSTDSVKETQALTDTQARRLTGLPQGEDLISIRDRAIIRFYIYFGARIEAGCKLRLLRLQVKA
jgi:integrase